MRAKVCPTSAGVGKQRRPGKYCRVTVKIIVIILLSIHALAKNTTVTTTIAAILCY